MAKAAKTTEAEFKRREKLEKVYLQNATPTVYAVKEFPASTSTGFQFWSNVWFTVTYSKLSLIKKEVKGVYSD